MRKLLLIGLFAAVFSATACSNSKGSQFSFPHAADASASLAAPLTKAQFDEVFPAMLLVIDKKYDKASPTLSKYALLGYQQAQSEVGMMYYAGAGLPLDRTEALKWLLLAAAQGDSSDQRTLAAATDGSLVAFPGSVLAASQLGGSGSPLATTDQSYQSEPAQATSSPFTSTYAPADSRAYSGAGATASATLLGSGGHIDSPSFSYGSGSSDASSRMVGAATTSTLTDERSGQRMDTIAGGYNDPRDGTAYTQAAGGVVNTRTGEFSPTHN